MVSHALPNELWLAATVREREDTATLYREASAVTAMHLPKRPYGTSVSIAGSVEVTPARALRQDQDLVLDPMVNKIEWRLVGAAVLIAIVPAYYAQKTYWDVVPLFLVFPVPFFVGGLVGYMVALWGGANSEINFSETTVPLVLPMRCTKDPFWDGTGDHELPSWAIVVHAQQYM